MKNNLINDIYFKIDKTQKFADVDFNKFVNIIENSSDIISLCNVEFNYLFNFIYKRRYNKYEMIKDILLRKIEGSQLQLVDDNIKEKLNTMLKNKYSNGILDLNICNNYILQYLDDESLLTKYILTDKKDILREISIYILETVIEDFAMNKEVEITKKILSDNINRNHNNKLIVHVDPFLILNKDRTIGQYVSSKNIIRLNELDVINLEYCNVKILDTIFHEIYHSVQLYNQFNDLNLILNIIDDEMRKDDKLSNVLCKKTTNNQSEDFTYIDYFSYMMKKENLLGRIIGVDNYNKLNYKLKFIEINARLNAHIELKKYLNSISIKKIYFYYKEIDLDNLINEEKENLGKSFYKKNLSGDYENLNDIFNRYLSFEFLDKYEFLNVEYNKDCSLKDSERLLNDLEIKILKTNDIDKIDRILDLYYNLIINNYDRKLITKFNTNNKYVIGLKSKLLNKY